LKKIYLENFFELVLIPEVLGEAGLGNELIVGAGLRDATFVNN